MDGQESPRDYWLVDGAGKDRVLAALPAAGDSRLGRLRERAVRRGRHALRVVVRPATDDGEEQT